MSGPGISVKEYAARTGMTEQAVYKQIRAGKLPTVERRENGKAKKYVIPPAQDQSAAAPQDPGHQPAPDPPQAAARAAQLPGSEAGRSPGPAAAATAPDVSRPDTQPPAQDQSAAALAQAIAALTAQLAEKDKQIARLQELLNQSQQLQAHSQRLLEQGPERAPDPTRQPPAPDVSEPDTQPPAQDQSAAAPQDPGHRPPKKRGFWAWLFGTDQGKE
jgi:hypothetical protein